jgi:epoxyqueuosine reductase
MSDPVKSLLNDLYHVLPQYTRFNQRFNMTRQVLWNPPMIALAQQRANQLHRLIESEQPGYTLRDYAFNRGAHANLAATQVRINQPNAGGTSWQSLITTQTKQRWRCSATEAAATILKASMLFGADRVGFCELDRRWVYSHYYHEDHGISYPIHFSDEPGYENVIAPCQQANGTQVISSSMTSVIVLLFEMDTEGISKAPTLTHMATTNVTYSHIATTIAMVAEMIRGLGYYAIPSINDTALSIPLAIAAGLGQLGRNGKLITPDFGPRCRIAKVITDLPLPAGHPQDFGFTEYCQICTRCADLCPAQAIPIGPPTYDPVNECNTGAYLAWHINHKQCYQYWTKVGTNCGICIAQCPLDKHHVRQQPFWK